MDYKRGDIVLVNFNPQRKAEEVGKIRPANNLSLTVYHTHSFTSLFIGEAQ